MGGVERWFAVGLLFLLVVTVPAFALNVSITSPANNVATNLTATIVANVGGSGTINLSIYSGTTFRSRYNFTSSAVIGGNHTFPPSNFLWNDGNASTWTTFQTGAVSGQVRSTDGDANSRVVNLTKVYSALQDVRIDGVYFKGASGHCVRANCTPSDYAYVGYDVSLSCLNHSNNQYTNLFFSGSGKCNSVGDLLSHSTLDALYPLPADCQINRSNVDVRYQIQFWTVNIPFCNIVIGYTQISDFWLNTTVPSGSVVGSSLGSSGSRNISLSLQNESYLNYFAAVSSGGVVNFSNASVLFSRSEPVGLLHSPQNGFVWCVQTPNATSACAPSAAFTNLSGWFSEWTDGDQSSTPLDYFGGEVYPFVMTKPQGVTNFSLLRVYSGVGVYSNVSIPNACWQYSANFLPMRLVAIGGSNYQGQCLRTDGSYEVMFTIGSSSITEFEMAWASDLFLPVMNLSRISPVLPLANDSLSLFCTGTSGNVSDGLSYEAEVFKNGVLNVSLSPSWCYQEFANMSTVCGGLSSGVYGTHPNGSMKAHIYVNYSKPVNATGAVWQVRHGSFSTYNVTVPSSCFSQSVLMVRLEADSWTMNSQGQCWNGSSWLLITNVSSSGTVQAQTGYEDWSHAARDGNYGTYAAGMALIDAFNFSRIGTVWSGVSSVDQNRWYEEGVWWRLGRPQGQEFYVGSVSGGLVRFDNWTLSCRAFNDNGFSSWLNSSVMIQNYPPTNEWSLFPYSFSHNASRVFGGHCSDLEGDALTFSSNSSVLPVLGNGSLNFTSGQNKTGFYVVNVTCSDPFSSSSSLALVNVTNAVPVASVSVGFVVGGVECDYVYSDADNDLELFSVFSWFRNGTSLNQSSFFLNESSYGLSDVLTCQVGVNDGLVSGFYNQSLIVGFDAPVVLASRIGFSGSGGVDDVFVGFCNASSNNSGSLYGGGLVLGGEWFVDGVFAGVGAAADVCYQEFVNQSSSCGGVAGGNVWFDDNVVLLSYVVPSTAYGAVWQVKHGVFESPLLYNVTLPSSCLSAGVLNVSLFSSWNGSLAVSYGSCYNGTAWQVVTVVQNHTSATAAAAFNGHLLAIDGDYDTAMLSNIFGVRLNATGGGGSWFEEGVWWRLAAPKGVERPVSSVSGVAGMSNLSFVCSAREFVSPLFFVEGVGFNVSVLVENTPPLVSNVSVVGGNLSGFLSCNYSYFDADGHPEGVSSYRWFRNGLLVNVSNQTIPFSVMSQQGAVVCEVRPFDGFDFGSRVNSSVFLIPDTIPPVLSSPSLPAGVTLGSSGNIDVVCSDNVNVSAVGVSFNNPNGVWESYSMSLLFGETYRRSYSFSLLGDYYNFTFVCTDGAGLNDTTGLMVNVTVVPAPSGGGGGGGGGAVPQSVVVVTGADNQTLFTVQTETGASSSQLLMYPSQKRLQTYIVQSYVQNDLSLDVSCEGNFCSFVSFSSDKLQLAGMQSLLLRAELSMPSSAQYGDVFQYSVRIADAAGRSALLQNQVQVSRLSRWYSKFLPVVREGDSGFWFGAGSYAVPKLLLYLLLVGIAVTTAYLLLPKERRYRDVATLVYVAVGLFTFVVASLVY